MQERLVHTPRITRTTRTPCKCERGQRIVNTPVTRIPVDSPSKRFQRRLHGACVACPVNTTKPANTLGCGTHLPIWMASRPATNRLRHRGAAISPLGRWYITRCRPLPVAANTILRPRCKLSIHRFKLRPPRGGYYNNPTGGRDYLQGAKGFAE